MIERYNLPPDMRLHSSSLPGHMLQLTIAGEVDYIVSGRQYHMTKGDFVWMHDVEQVAGQAGPQGWSLISVCLIAPLLMVPPMTMRMRRVDTATQKLFARLLNIWSATDVAPLVREMRVQAGVLELLALLFERCNEGADREHAYQINADARLWWEIESHIRQQLDTPHCVDDFVQLTGKSPATINRACRAAVGLSPMRRVRHIRMNAARGLLRYSDLSISEIADRLGFSRVHELSRDYHRHFGFSPMKDRKRWVDLLERRKR